MLALAALAAGLVGTFPAHAYTAKGVGVLTALRGAAAVTHAPPVAAREGGPAQEPLRFKDDVFFQDVIDTQRDSIAKLLLRGPSTFTIRELSRVELREGVVAADPTRTRSIISLRTGLPGRHNPGPPRPGRAGDPDSQRHLGRPGHGRGGGGLPRHAPAPPPRGRRGIH